MQLSMRRVCIRHDEVAEAAGGRSRLKPGRSPTSYGLYSRVAGCALESGEEPEENSGIGLLNAAALGPLSLSSSAEGCARSCASPLSALRFRPASRSKKLMLHDGKLFQAWKRAFLQSSPRHGVACPYLLFSLGHFAKSVALGSFAHAHSQSSASNMIWLR